MPHVDFNWVSVIVAAFIPLVIGALWYSPLLFGKKWMEILKLTEEDIKKGNPAKAHALSFLGYIVMAYVIDYVIFYTLSDTFWLGMKKGIMCWGGFVVVSMWANYLYERSAFSLFFINAGFNLVIMALMGGLLATW